MGPVEVALNKPALDIWDRVLRVFTELLGKAEVGSISKAACEFIQLLVMLLYSYLTMNTSTL
jgi:hypothetical protein